MKLLKTASLLLAAVLCVLPLSGCHGSVQHSEFMTPAEFDETAIHEITFWAKNDTNRTQTDIYNKAISDFEKLYPNIKVNMRLYTDYGKIYNDVITNISTSTTPNVCITYPDHIATYLNGSNVVVSLEDLAYDERYGLGGSKLKFDSPSADEVVQQFLGECVVNGKLYGIPFMRSTEACYVNKTYVEALGYTLPEDLTWDFIWEVSDAAAKKNPDGTFAVNGQSVMIPFIYKSTDNMMIQMLKQKNAGYSNDSGEILIFNDTTKELLRTIADHTSKGAFSTFKISGYPANFLNAGQCIFAIDSTAGSTWMGSNAPLSDICSDKKVEFETEVMAIPQFDTENPAMISQGPSICIFNKDDPQEVLASWLFAQYLLTNEIQIGYSKTEGYLPVTKKAQESKEYKDYLSKIGEDNNEHYDVKIKASMLLMENQQSTFVTSVFAGSTSLRDAAGQMIENTVKSVRRKEKVDDAYFDSLFEKMTALYRLDSLAPNSGNESEAPDDMSLPRESVILLSTLCGVWVLIILYGLISSLKKWKKRRKTID